MAKKRMFSISVVDSDNFLDMPLSAQALYFHLNVRADDDGFVDNPKRIMRTIGAAEDDLSILILRRFVIRFEDGVVVIKHWRVHNTIQSDRYTRTVYEEDLARLGLKKNKEYTLRTDVGNTMDTVCIQTGNNMETKRIQAVSTDIDIDIDIDIDKVSKGLGKGSDIDKYSDIGIHDNAGAMENDEQEDVFICIPLKTGEGEFPVDEKYLEKLKDLYPAVDVEQELRNMVGWCDSNPKNRKTRNGVKRFITGWLSRSQNSARTDRAQGYARKDVRNMGTEEYMQNTDGWYQG